MNRPLAFSKRDPSHEPIGLSPISLAAWQGLACLLVANAIGVWLAFLLLVPSANSWTGSWTYGRWMPVHLNLQLYGWISLPLIAWLIRVYHADSISIARWSRAALWLWCAALAIGSIDWLRGRSTGKLFLDWSGYVRVFYPLAILFLWAVFAAAFARSIRAGQLCSRLAVALRAVGLLLLALVPFAIYAASSPNIYPPVNPDSGGPTAASQLESVLVIVLILFLLPYGVSSRNARRPIWIIIGWSVLFLEALLCLCVGPADVSHHRLTQSLSLGSLLVWVPLMPAYYRAFHWQQRTRAWRIAVLCWWALLIPTGWSLFLPGVLDHLKFTDGLVSHSLLAMAGFVTSLLILMLIILLGEEADAFASRWSFIAWQAATLLYVLLMIGAGWIEGSDPTFTMVPSLTRNVVYLLRLLLGVAMTLASADWLLRLTRILYASQRPSQIEPQPVLCPAAQHQPERAYS